MNSLTGGKTPLTGGPEEPKGEKKSFVSQADKKLQAYDVFNRLIADNLDPYKAIPDAQGRLNSAYPALQADLGADAARRLFTAAYMFNQNKDYSKLKGEERLRRFYDNVSTDKHLEMLKAKMKNYFGTNDPLTSFRNSPLLPLGGTVGGLVAR